MLGGVLMGEWRGNEIHLKPGPMTKPQDSMSFGEHAPHNSGMSRACNISILSAHISWLSVA